MKFAFNILLIAFAACVVASAAGFAELRGEYAQGTIPPAISGNGHKKAQRTQKAPHASMGKQLEDSLSLLCGTCPVQASALYNLKLRI